MNRATFLRLLLLAPLGGQQLRGESGSLQQSADYLLRRQSPDGAWRSPVYGAFRSGHALTPIIIRSLCHLEHPDAATAIDRAANWLISQKQQVLKQFPVHLASAILEIPKKVDQLDDLRAPALHRLLQLQGGPDQAWSYSPRPLPRDPDTALAPMQQPNLSATAIAIDGLRAAGNQQTAIKQALPFIRRCQNHGSGDPKFDDGGFFQMPLDPARNKAGQAGKDRQGNTRFHSYSAATADGLRCLFSAGLTPDAAEAIAAGRWLRRFSWTASGAADAPADLAYYSARSIALTRAFLKYGTGSAELMQNTILKACRRDGSWINPAGEMRENCPLVATSLAFEACALLRRSMDIPNTSPPGDRPVGSRSEAHGSALP